MQAGFLTFVESYAIHVGTPCTMHRVRRTGPVHAKAFHDRRHIAERSSPPGSPHQG